MRQRKEIQKHQHKSCVALASAEHTESDMRNRNTRNVQSEAGNFSNLHLKKKSEKNSSHLSLREINQFKPCGTFSRKQQLFAGRESMHFAFLSNVIFCNWKVMTLLVV
jgi:hypothetical protein